MDFPPLPDNPPPPGLVPPPPPPRKSAPPPPPAKPSASVAVSPSPSFTPVSYSEDDVGVPPQHQSTYAYGHEEDPAGQEAYHPTPTTTREDTISYPHATSDPFGKGFTGGFYDEEPKYLKPDYQVHPMLRNDDAGYRPYKRKATSTSNDDDDIRPNLAYQSSSSSSSSSSSNSSRYHPYPSAPSNHSSSSSYPGAAPPPKRVLPTREEAYEMGPRPNFSGGGGLEDTRKDHSGGNGVAPYKRRTFSVEESREKLAAKKESASGAAIMNSVVASIREKLQSGGKISRGQAKILNRDQDIVSSINMPTYVAHRTGSGLTPEEIRKAQEEHTRKLLGWKYHVASKARNEQALQAKRKK